MARTLLRSIGVVELEFVVLNVLRQSIHFDFRLMYLDPWVKHRDCVDFTLSGLPLKYGALTNTY
jgi:hypothetical protein